MRVSNAWESQCQIKLKHVFKTHKRSPCWLAGSFQFNYGTDQNTKKTTKQQKKPNKTKPSPLVADPLPLFLVNSHLGLN